MTGGRSRWVAGAVLAAAFLAGAVVGAAGYRYLGPSGAAPAAARTDDPGEGRREGGGSEEEHDRGPTSAMLEILRDDVGISDAREREVRSILERREERAREMFEGVRERFHRWMDTTVVRIQGVLSEEQAAEFERRLEERMEERRRERRDRHGDGADSRRREPGGTAP